MTDSFNKDDSNKLNEHIAFPVHVHVVPGQIIHVDGHPFAQASDHHRVGSITFYSNAKTLIENDNGYSTRWYFGHAYNAPR